jgi:hypothetical protein
MRAERGMSEFILTPTEGPRPRRPFYAGTAMSTNATQDYGTSMELFDAICRRWGGASPEARGEDIPRPWVDPCASEWNRLVPRYFSLPGGGGEAEDGLVQSWGPPTGVPRFVVFNPVYEDAEEVCPPRCKKKGCKERGFCLSERKPGMGDWLLKAEAEALAWGGPIIGILPMRSGTSWYRRAVHPPPSFAGRFIRGEAWPGELSPMAPYALTSAVELYVYERLEVEAVRLAGRQQFRPPPGAVSTITGKPLSGKDSAGFETVLIAWKGRQP